MPTRDTFALSARFSRRLLAVCSAFAISASLPSAVAADDLTELVPGTAILLDQSTGTGSGGNSKTVSSSTNIFAPATFVDYKRFGGEPTVVVDRYPFNGGTFKDIAYQSAPQGFVFPHYSQIYKSDDLGQSFRKSQQFPVYGLAQIQAGGGGGDSHLAVGKVTHDVYFVDLTLFPGVTMNVSTDLGEHWTTSDVFGAGLNLLDDRQWVEADEEVDRVYVSTNNLANLVTPTLIVALNHTGWPTAGALTSPCSPAVYEVGSNPVDPSATDAVPTPCPDPADPYLWVSGPVVADNEGYAKRPTPSHDVYIPFIRRISEPFGLGLKITGWELYVARSTDTGATWTRHRVASLPANVDPANIFPELTIDRGGNLYYTWSQARNASTVSARGKRTEPDEEFTAGEQDVYYTFSTKGGTAGTWAPPIDLTPSANDSAIFPWMVAGDPGQVDLTFYKSNSGLNSNVAVDAVWNVYFAQSQNALNTGSNFNTVQVTAQPNHLGGICTGGVSCEGDRDLLDFITIDVDHLGAAHIAYSDDNRRRASDTQDFMTRQIAGNSVFKNQTIGLQSSWPIRDHAVSDRSGDVYDTTSSPKGSCLGMDLLGMTVDRQDDRITASLTLNSAPTAAKAAACGGIASLGGIWGVEFWAAAAGDPSVANTTGPSNRFYIAYRDDPSGTRVEGGTMDHVNPTVTSLEPNSRTLGTLGGTCLPSGGPPASGTCTITLTVTASKLGITPGNALNNVTGISLYSFGVLEEPIPLTRVILGNSEQADATAPMHFLGSGTP